MDNYLFTHALEVRYGDLDPQGHMNNARFLSFFEQGRFAYLIHLGLFDGKSFQDLKSIIADIHISFLAPATLMQKIIVGVRVERIGNKSLTFQQAMVDSGTGKVVAECQTVIVTYDYHGLKSIPVPEEWRKIISTFEKKDFGE